VADRIRRRPGSGAGSGAALLFAAGAVLVLIPPAAFATFDWRYQLPQLTLIPVAAVLGLAAWPGTGSRITRRPSRCAARTG
jgi:hypothetical protein